ncbi:MAG: DEAD/DEAH box helicase [Clostridiales bacterium]|nr:DEAD/DEAH box helicase [Clostridiales bacterium]
MEYRPHNYQSYCIERIVNDPAVGLFLRPGLGKTSITLSAINILRYYQWSIRRALIVAPKKVAEGTWSKEAAKWDHLKHLRVETVLGSSAKRIKVLNTPADVYVINRENIPWLVDYYKQAWPFDMVVLDESTSFKNGRSQRFKALKLVRRFMKKVVLLTGTPSSAGIEDLWAQIYLLDEGQRLGKTITQYRQMYFDCNTHGGHFTEYSAKDGAEAAVLNAISDICISMKAEDYLELPACVEHEIPVILDSKARKAYDQFERDLLLQIDEDVITANTAGVLTGKLLQFCSGAIYDDDKCTVHLHDCKLDTYLELLEQLNGEHCITFYGFQHDKERILAALAKTKLRVRVYKDTKDEDDWNAGKIDVLLVHPASCAYGLNLQAGGRHIIWFTPNWSFELNDQGKCRLWRQGSTYDKVFVHYLVVQGCVDEDVLATVRDRAGTHENVMSVLKARIRKIKSVEELK